MCSSARRRVVFASFVGIELSSLPIDIRALMNSNSGAKRGALIKKNSKVTDFQYDKYQILILCLK